MSNISSKDSHFTSELEQLLGNQLHQAVSAVNTDALQIYSNRNQYNIETMMKIGADPNFICDGQTVLTNLIISLNHRTSEMFLRKDQIADYEKKNYNDIDSSIEIIKTLLDKGLDVNQKNPHTGDTALHYLSISPLKYSKIVKFLLDNGADPELTNINGHKPLDYLTYDDNLKFSSDSAASRSDAMSEMGFKNSTIAEELMSEKPENLPNFSEKISSKYEQKTIKFLLTEGKNFTSVLNNNPTSEELDQYLVRAVAEKNPFKMEMLIQKGANLEQKLVLVNSDSVTLLQNAALSNDPERLEILIKLGADLSYTDSPIGNLIVSSPIGGDPWRQLECFELLAKYDIDPNPLSNVLIKAFESDNVDPSLIQYLLKEVHADPKFKDSQGRTADSIYKYGFIFDRRSYCVPTLDESGPSFSRPIMADNFIFKHGLSKDLIRGVSPRFPLRYLDVEDEPSTHFTIIYSLKERNTILPELGDYKAWYRPPRDELPCFNKFEQMLYTDFGKMPTISVESHNLENEPIQNHYFSDQISEDEQDCFAGEQLNLHHNQEV